jgi:hypothetical protein
VKSLERFFHRLLWMDRLVGSIRELAPYAALVFALPGGGLIALALWAARHHQISTLRWRRVRALMIVVVAVSLSYCRSHHPRPSFIVEAERE